MINIVGLMLVKGESKRLPHKNTKILWGKPMFLWNLEKALRVLDDVYVSSEDDKILEIAKKAGAHTIKRPVELCGDTPNIPVYQHAIKFMECPNNIIAIQANSPNLDENLISDAKYLMEYGFKEVMTCHKDYSIYGSIWGLEITRLKNYGDFYSPNPDVLLIDDSVDVHTKEDFEQAKKIMRYGTGRKYNNNKL